MGFKSGNLQVSVIDSIISYELLYKITWKMMEDKVLVC